jgi:YYY domain-containing protein
MTGLSSLLSWYLAISIAGWFTFAITFHLFKGLPDRGYSVSRIIGWLLWGYLFWILASIQIVRNNWMGIVACLAFLFFLGAWSLQKGKLKELKEWFSQERKTVLVFEAVFLVSFVAWSYIRSTNPDAVGTEKPMELAFINAILRSETFPPHDPWLAGYAISYYHFGYILVAMLARFTGTAGGVAFNLGSALVFALSATGASGLVYNVITSRPQKTDRGKSLQLSMLGPVMLLFFSNLEGFLHSLHNRGFFWKENTAGELYSSFWSWMDILDLDTAPVQPFSWIPERFWWWWRASRVIQDYDMQLNPREIINEFPFFSFLLADLHPHVLAIPCALLCITLAFHALTKESPARLFGKGRLRIFFSPAEYLLIAILTGAMGFLNTWDFPIYVILLASTTAFRQLYFINQEAYPSKLGHWFKEFIIHSFAIGLGGLILYLPFYLSFSSQAGGILVNLIYPTRGVHLWVMFGGLFVLLGLFLLFLFRKENELADSLPSLRKGILLALGLVSGLWFISLVLFGLGLLNPELRNFYPGSLGATNPASLLVESLERRWMNGGGLLTLIALFTLALTLILRSARRSPYFPEFLGNSEIFTLVLILLGCMLVIGTEFFFLRDQFGWRMNTVFKFYYQAWILWAVASAIGTAILWISLNGKWRLAFQVCLGGVLFVGLVYPLLSLPSKSNLFNISEWGLDGGAYLQFQNPAEMAAIGWLKTADFGVIAEAVSPTGGSYTGYGRVSTLSGLPGVLGWMGHESQWRGGPLAMGNRQADLIRLFCSRDPTEINDVIQKYQIKYIFVGSLERSTYSKGSESCTRGINEAILSQLFKPVFQSGDIIIYSVPGQ